MIKSSYHYQFSRKTTENYENWSIFKGKTLKITKIYRFSVKITENYKNLLIFRENHWKILKFAIFRKQKHCKLLKFINSKRKTKNYKYFSVFTSLILLISFMSSQTTFITAVY